MSTVSLIRQQLKVAHEWFEGTIEGVTQAHADWQPPGTAHPIGSRYAHAVVDEDVMINVLAQGGAPLYTTSWSGRTGISDPQFAAEPEWARSVRVDLEKAREYGRAVYANTYAYLSGLADEDLDRELDLSEYGFGVWSLGAFFITFVLGHMRDVMGEISATKGIQGLAGYPF